MSALSNNFFTPVRCLEAKSFGWRRKFDMWSHPARIAFGLPPASLTEVAVHS